MGNLGGNSVVEQTRPTGEMLTMTSMREKCNFPKQDEDSCAAAAYINNALPSVSDEIKCCTQLKGSLLALPFHSYKTNPLAVDLTVKKASQENKAQMVILVSYLLIKWNIGNLRKINQFHFENAIIIFCV